jgi:hypothetical protein
MLKKLLLLVVLVYWVQSSYSESITPYYGYTGNAASGGNTWSMDTYLPSGIPGLDINGVIYNYTIQKQLNDSVTVNVQNENANGTGYIFRETDEWKPGSLGGTQINKVVPVVPSNRALWGDGSIEVTGNGSVTDPNVVYTYKVDPCYDPQFDPNCPGYQRPAPTVVEVDPSTLYNVLNDENVSLNFKADQEMYDEEEGLSEEELAEKEAKEKEDGKERLEKALAAADNSALFANALANSQILSAMNAAVQMNQYYAANIDGGEYRESVTLDGGNIPDNPKGRRLNLSTQKLHQEMVEEQYK